jgi:hypothetical protein
MITSLTLAVPAMEMPRYLVSRILVLSLAFLVAALTLALWRAQFDVNGSATATAVTDETGVATAPEFIAGESFGYVIGDMPEQLLDGTLYWWDGANNPYSAFFFSRPLLPHRPTAPLR